MPLMPDVGPYEFLGERTITEIQYVPPADRDLELIGLLITNPSADDSWVVSVSGREMLRFRINQNGNQQVLGVSSSTIYQSRDFFEWYRETLEDEFMVPVPSGIALQINSIGGATADIVCRFRDMTKGSVNSSMPNHYMGNRYIQLRYGYLAAAVTATGELAIDTEHGTGYMPNVFLGQPIPAGWQVNVRALWLEAMSTNTFTGGANHVSFTDHWSLVVDQEPLFTRIIAGDSSPSPKGFAIFPGANLVTPGGIPAFPPVAAAGSANTVFGRGTASFPPFQIDVMRRKAILEPMISLSYGDSARLYLNVQGDITGNPSYANCMAVALVEYIRIG